MYTRRILTNALLSALFLCSIFACNMDNKNPLPDVSSIEVEVEVKHFEQDLFSMDTSNTEAELERLKLKYPEFTEIFFEQLFPIYEEKLFPEGPVAVMNGFITDTSIQKMYALSQELYGDMSSKDFQKPFQYFKYYFPDREVPDITTFVSEYTISNFIYGENSLATGLDFFLGENYPYLDINAGNPNFSNYLTRHYNKDHIVRNTLIPFIDDMNAQRADRKLLDYMIDNGKELFILKSLMPEVADTVIHLYSPDQLQWVRENEQQIYAHLIDQQLLYSTNWQDFRKLIDHSPNSPGMPQEAPGRTANYIGFRIVEDYMKNNPQVSFEDLLKLNDAQEFLARSRYRPAN